MSLILASEYFFSGLFMKLSDDEFDNKNNKSLAIIFGFICGILSALASVSNPDAAIIFIAILIGNLIGLKVDGIHHIVTLVTFILICFIFSLPSFNLYVLLICIFAAFFDEFGHDNKNIYKKSNYLKLFFEYRFFMKVIILILALFGLLSFWSFLYFILFELAYEIGGKLSKEIL